MKIQFKILKKNKQMEKNRNQLVKDDTIKCVTIGFVIYYFSIQEVSKDDSVSIGICYQVCGPEFNSRIYTVEEGN